MEGKLAEKSCVKFAEALASKAPVPGGGGAAALVGGYGAALCAMAGNLTIGRKKYTSVQEDIRKMLEKCGVCQKRLIELVDEDAAVFEPLSKAYSIPKDDPDRERVLEETTKQACQAPLEMMVVCCEVIEVLEEMLEKGNSMLVSDVGCGALCCAAALEAASMNVFVNIRTLRDKEAAKAMEQRVDSMLDAYLPRAKKVAEGTMRRLRSRE